MLTKRAYLMGVCGLSLLGLVIWGSFNYLGSQEKPKPKLKEKKEVVETRGESGKTPDHKGTEVKNDPKGETVEKRAGANTCDVHVDNRTNFIIHRIYIDGRYVGRVGPLGDLYAYDVLSGPTRLYAEAEFTTGKRWWGPMTVNCPSYITYSWRLH